MKLLTLTKFDLTTKQEQCSRGRFEHGWRFQYGDKEYPASKEYPTVMAHKTEFNPNNFWKTIDENYPWLLEYFGIDTISPETVSAFDYNGDLYTWDDIAGIEESIDRHTTARF